MLINPLPTLNWQHQEMMHMLAWSTSDNPFLWYIFNHPTEHTYQIHETDKELGIFSLVKED